MIQTEVKTIGRDAHALHVRLSEETYRNMYNRKLNELKAQVKMPGFRNGKIPGNIIEQRFGQTAREQTATALIEEHYVSALTHAKLVPAIEPEIEMPKVKPADGFEFSMNVYSYPHIELRDDSELQFSRFEYTVDDEDVDAEITRLRLASAKFLPKEEGGAQTGDQIGIQFSAVVGDELLDEGKIVPMTFIVGDNRQLPEFEEHLIGATVGERKSFDLTFPTERSNPNLAGKTAHYEVQVVSVATPELPDDDSEMATRYGYEDVAELRNEVRSMLERRAANESYEQTEEALLMALLATYKPEINEKLVEAETHATLRHEISDARKRGEQVNPAHYTDPQYQAQIQQAAVQRLQIMVVLHALLRRDPCELTQSELNAVIDEMALDYPKSQQDGWKQWFRHEHDRMKNLQEKLIQKKIVNLVTSRAQTERVRKPVRELSAHR